MVKILRVGEFLNGGRGEGKGSVWRSLRLYFEGMVGEGGER